MTSQTSEETHNTRESAKKVLKEYYGYKSEQDVPNGLAAVLEDWLHHQLQKARQDWLREEIVKLDGETKELVTMNCYGNCNPRCHDSGKDIALTSIITRYKEELLGLEKGV